MAKNTPTDFRSLVIYEIFTRAHSAEGTFDMVIRDLPRIKSLGVDIIWLMPIHPIGKIARKGILGSPYSIVDYFAINPEYGNLDNFKDLLESAHKLDLKVMIDVVYNHTAHDSIILEQHPDWYHKDPDGKPVTTVPEWSDVIDLDFNQSQLWDYLISALEYWVRLGVDGFRCDVASVVPLDFWKRARAAVDAINPDMIWLAESVHALWIAYRRNQNLRALSDSELYQVFDITYDYDIFEAWRNTLSGQLDNQYYMDLLRFQDAIYPENYVKMRYVENHDTDRIMAAAKDRDQALAWTALQAFNKGAWLIYCGQESGCDHKPSLFKHDPISWGNYELSDFINNLALLKKHKAVRKGQLVWITTQPAITGIWHTPEESLTGIFNVNGKKGKLKTNLPNGDYKDYFNGDTVSIMDGETSIPKNAAIFSCRSRKEPLPYESLILGVPEI